jgi:hypothetical protein
LDRTVTRIRRTCINALGGTDTLIITDIDVARTGRRTDELNLVVVGNGARHAVVAELQFLSKERVQ